MYESRLATVAGSQQNKIEVNLRQAHKIGDALAAMMMASPRQCLIQISCSCGRAVSSNYIGALCFCVGGFMDRISLIIHKIKQFNRGNDSSILQTLPRCAVCHRHLAVEK